MRQNPFEQSDVENNSFQNSEIWRMLLLPSYFDIKIPYILCSTE
jgi:hypothetical protein